MLLLKCSLNVEGIQEVWFETGFSVGWLLFPPQILESVADDGLDHKCVFKVTDSVTPFRLAPFDAWKRRRETIRFLKKICDNIETARI